VFSREATVALSCGREPAEDGYDNEWQAAKRRQRGKTCCRRFAAISTLIHRQPTAYAVGYVLPPLRGYAPLFLKTS